MQSRTLPADFNTQLIQHLGTLSVPNSVLQQAMRYALSSGGKRLRPAFVYEAAALTTLDAEATRLLALSIEMVHIFSLVHDDLPCLDNDDFRRGILTTHKKFDEAQALLAGDALLSAAFETFNECAAHVTSSHFVSASRHFSKCIGAEGMIAGQSLELEIKNPTKDEIEKIHSLKTTALFRASILTPLLFAGVSINDKLFIECAEYATAFGFAFQIADDLEDEAQDQIQGAKNILSLYPREGAKTLALQKLSEPPIASHFSATNHLKQKLL